MSGPAGAYKPFRTASCDKITWSSQPEYVIHLTEFWNGGGLDSDDLSAMFEAVYDVAEQFNLAGATSARVTPAYINASISAFEPGVWFNDPVPTIHIGFTDDPVVFLNAGGATYRPDPDAACEISEAHIVFPDMNHEAWNFGTPGEIGEDYHTAGETDTAGRRYFRPPFLHELLHAFGLDHSNSYSFTNYNDLPWAGGGRSEREAIRPLPDDVEGLRRLYRDGGSRSEVAVLNSWHDFGVKSGGSTIQHGLCSPSLGTSFSSNKFRFAPGCGEGGPDGGSTVVCTGDKLYTRFAFANYSTDTADDIDVRAYFSTDDVLDSTDLDSPTHREATVYPQDALLKGMTWDVPSGLQSGDEYFVIIYVGGFTSSGAFVEDWIPLRGKVTGC
jgi:hypothetical protein